jgi:hypothetical protein
MEDRIQINGEWYVREQPTPATEPEIELDITDNVIRFKGMVFESDKYCFEATKLAKTGLFEEAEYYISFDVEFTDKRVKPWKVDEWDNITWMKGILIDNPNSLDDLRESVCPQGEAEFKAFLKILKQEGWL